MYNLYGDFMYTDFNISEKLIKLSEEAEKELIPTFNRIDKISALWSSKVLKAFQDVDINTTDFNEVVGYGYEDSGRDKLEEVYAHVFGAEDALVRPQIMSGTHALTLCLSGLLKYGDTMISISGIPYDTIRTVIGTEGDSESSLIKNGIKYEEIDLIDNDFDYEAIKKRLEKNDVKLVEIQRSLGYAPRLSLTIDKIEKVIKEIRKVNKYVIILVDNCYGDFVEEKEPTEVGADVLMSSLMKNLGSGIATSGGYIVGKKKYIHLIAERLTAPGVGKNMGANFNVLSTYYKGIYLAPSVVASALKTMSLAAYMLEKLGYKVSPRYNDNRADIIQVVELGTEEKLKSFCEGLQRGGAIESKVKPIPCEMPGYPHEEMMGGSTFIPASTIELSCDGPMRPPYNVFMQGSLTYDYGKLGILIALNNMEE